MPVTLDIWPYSCGELPSNVVPSWVSTPSQTGSWYGSTLVGVPNDEPVGCVRYRNPSEAP